VVAVSPYRMQTTHRLHAPRIAHTLSDITWKHTLTHIPLLPSHRRRINTYMYQYYNTHALTHTRIPTYV
jgi:hypothetical protein